MSDATTKEMNSSAETEVLTLSEVAAYLRVNESAVLKLVKQEGLPGKKIGSDWRFLKRAVAEWLQFGPQLYHDFRMFPPPWHLDSPYWGELLQAIEKRMSGRMALPAQSSIEPGTKEAVLKQFGVFRSDPDMESRLAEIRARREASVE